MEKQPINSDNNSKGKIQKLIYLWIMEIMRFGFSINLLQFC